MATPQQQAVKVFLIRRSDSLSACVTDSFEEAVEELESAWQNPTPVRVKFTMTYVAPEWLHNLPQFEGWEK